MKRPRLLAVVVVAQWTYALPDALIFAGYWLGSV